MARFPDLLAEEPNEEKPDPVQEELKQLREAQAAAALSERERAAAEQARMEQLEKLYAANQPQYQAPPTPQTPLYTPPVYTQDEILADPQKIYEIAEASKIQGQQEIVGALSPVLENMSEGTYISKKSTLQSHPYYKFAEKDLDEWAKRNTAHRGDPRAVQAKFNEIVGANVEEYQHKLEAEAPQTADTRRVPVKERQVSLSSNTSASDVESESKKNPLTEDQERYRVFFNEKYGLNSSPEEYKKISDGELFPGQRVKR